MKSILIYLNEIENYINQKLKTNTIKWRSQLSQKEFKNGDFHPNRGYPLIQIYRKKF